MDAIPVTKKVITFGSKQIFLPKFTIALTRTPNLSPYHARFLVPLSFSKYDLRDYLYHAYKIKCFNIRSYVRQMPVRDTQELPGHHFRPEAQKYMTVEMEKPFVWPAEPESWEPWGKEEKEREMERGLKAQGALTTEMVRESQDALRRQARALLKRGTESKRAFGSETGKSQERWAKKRSDTMLGKRVK